jgi:hypothetical protein
VGFDGPETSTSSPSARHGLSASLVDSADALILPGFVGIPGAGWCGLRRYVIGPFRQITGRFTPSKAPEMLVLAGRRGHRRTMPAADRTTWQAQVPQEGRFSPSTPEGHRQVSPFCVPDGLLAFSNSRSDQVFYSVGPEGLEPPTSSV